MLWAQVQLSMNQHCFNKSDPRLGQCHYLKHCLIYYTRWKCMSVFEMHRQQAIIWTNADPIHLRIYAARILVITATNRNGQNLNGHKPKRPQTGTATDRNGHKPKWPQTGTATNRNGHKPKRPQTETATNQSGHKPERPQTGTATNKNRHNYIWFSGLQICVLNIRFKLVSRSRQK